MDAVAVEAFLSSNADCADRERAEAALAEMLATARAPHRASARDGRWRVDVAVTTERRGLKSALAKISDDRGRVVAERSLSDRTAGTCVALARAVGAWAQLVLDDEVARAQGERAEDKRVAPAPTAPATPAAPTAQTVQTAPGPARVTPELPAGADAAPDLPTKAGNPRSVEVGNMVFVRNGAATNGGIVGISPFIAYAFADAWIARPSLALGTTTTRIAPDGANGEQVTYLGGRLDLCRRIPGNYIERRGLEFDACLGGDVAHVWSHLESRTLASVGPSGILRGELGANFALEIRAMVGANLIQNRGASPILDASSLQDRGVPPIVIAGEVGGSWRFR